MFKSTTFAGPLSKSWQDAYAFADEYFIKNAATAEDRIRDMLCQNEKSRLSAGVLKNCEQSLKGMHQARLWIRGWQPPLDDAFACQPIVSTINVICGRAGDDRFKPVSIGLLLESLARLSRVGMLQAVIRMPRDLVETEILRACGIIYVQTMDLTDEARQAVLRVAEELDTLVSELNIAARAK